VHFQNAFFIVSKRMFKMSFLFFTFLHMIVKNVKKHAKKSGLEMRLEKNVKNMRFKHVKKCE